MTSSRPIWVLGGIFALLLTALNVQLLVDRPAQDDTAAIARVPALPDDGSSLSGEAVLRELDDMTRSLKKPLESLRKDLRRATEASVEPLGKLGPELSALGRGSDGIQASLRDLDGTGRQLLEVTALTKLLPAAFAELRRFRAITLPMMIKELKALRRETRGLTQGIPALSNQLSETRGTLSDVTTTLKDTNAALDRAAACLRRPILCK